ncbi:YfhO family protein [Gemmatimonas groenlandica]|uniref:YfhO family protein n=1 Tax=Gemmatimonas groenlandica TaxID=2732249 RepID=A0A6M4INM4_9BACT|nr:YfhO family protein [Gemmatimonas groenlandica]QJR35087.1 YfhO family protein [Gemmatimonas groenlandica]
MARTDATNVAPPAPRFPLAWAALVCVIATMLLAWPALGGAFLVNPNSDQYIAGYSFREFAARALRDGQGFPQWNPYQFGGMPYVAAMHGDIFYPTFLLRLVLPTDIAMTWGFVLHMLLAGVFTVGFLRAAGVRFQSAVVGGIAYLLSGAVASYASPGHDGKLFVSALLPAALWALVRGLRDGRRGAWGLLALIVGLAVLSPHPQLLQYMLLTCGGYALFLALRPWSLPAESSAPGRDASPSRPLTRLALALGAVVLGAVIGAVQYLPVQEYVPWSPRAGGKGYDYATSFSFPLEETINMYLPQFSGILEKYWGRNGIHFHSEYIGATVLVLALFAFGGGLANRNRSHAWFWLGALIVSLVWAWGGNTPFYQLVYAVVPGSKFFRAPSTILYVTAFSCAVLAAFGAERLLAGKGTSRYAIGWGSFALLVGVLATTGAFTNVAMSLLGDARGELIEANAASVVGGAWRSAVAVLALVGLMLAVARGALKAALAGWLLAALVALDLWSVERHYWTFSARAEQLYAEDDIIRFLKSQTEPTRVIAIPLGDNMAPHDPFVLGDALMHHGIRGVLGYHGNEIGRYQELYGKSDGFQSIANPNFWSLTNARFFYTNTPGLPFQGAKLAAGPVRNAAGTMTYLYELPGDHPAAWVAPLIVKLDDPTTKATVLNPLFDVKRVAIFDTTSTIQAKPVNSPLPDPVPFGVEITKYQAGAIDIILGGPAPAGSALLVSENYYPGWTATVDGKPATIARADYTLIGVELPTGAKSVQLRFDSAPYHTGKLLTLLALGAALLWWIIGFALDRKADAPANVLAA